MKKLRDIFEAISQWAQLIILIAYIATMFLIVLRILEPFSPAITFLFVLVLTAHTFERKWLGVISLCGIAIYILSWPVTGKCGLYVGLSVWAAGFSTWFWAVCRSFHYSPRTA